MRKSARFWIAMAACLGSAGALLSSCGEDEPVKCRFTESRELPEGLATSLSGAKLLAANGNFVLAGIDGTTVQWVPVSANGELSAASTFVLTEPTALAPQLALTGRTTPGDQLVAVYGTANAEGQLTLRAVTQVAGEAAAAPVTVATLPRGLASGDVRLAVGSTRTGSRALVAFGLASQPGTKLQTLVLGANAAPVGPALEFPPGVPSWQCLQFLPSRTDWVLSWVEVPPTGNAKIVIQEGSASNGALTRYNVGLGTNDVGCPVMGPSSRGYVMSWQTKTGTWVLDYETNATGVIPEFVAGTIRFGGPEQQPPVSGVASMGLRSAVTFGVKEGPEVWLFDIFGAREGRELKLPSSVGSVGLVSTWPVDDAFFVTYREGVPASSGPSEGPRRFMKVDCPAE